MPQLFSALRVLGRHTVMKSALAGVVEVDETYIGGEVARRPLGGDGPAILGAARAP